MLPSSSPPELRERENQVHDLIPALDGVRGLAVLMVLLDHASDTGLRIFAGADINRAGKYGVYLFFCLSAFLLTYPFFLRPASELLQPRLWANYWVRRILRILPLYILVLVVYNWDRDAFHTYEVWQHLLLRDGQGHFWTVPVEFKYYMVLPIFVLTFGWVWQVKGWKWGLAAGLSFYFIFLGLMFFPLERMWAMEKDIWLSRSIHGFLFGSLAGILHAWIVRNRFHRRWLPGLGEAVALVSLVAVMLFIPGIFNALFNAGQDVKSFEEMDEFCSVAWPLFILGIVHGMGWLRWIFESRVLRYLGLVSYSAYLWHKMVLGRLDGLEILPESLRLIGFVLVVVAVASVSYWVVERPLSLIRLTRKKNPITPAGVPIPLRAAS